MKELLSRKFETFTSIENYDHNEIKFEDIDYNDNYGFQLKIHYYDRGDKFTLKQKYITKEVFDENFKNPIYHLIHRRMTAVVAHDDKRITFKFFLYTRTRRPNEKFLRITSNCAFLTYNFKRNCFYTGMVNGYHKKKKVSKSVKVVTFTNDVVNDALSKYLTWYKFVYENNPEYTFVSNDFYTLIGTFIDNIPGVVYDKDKYSCKTLYKTVLNKKNIKLSDNWSTFMGHYPQPKAADYKKYGDRYLDVMMGINGFKGDKIRRVLHKSSNFNKDMFKKAASLFGQDYILGKPDEELISLFDSTTSPDYMNVYFASIRSKKERNCIYEIFKLVVSSEIAPNTFSDHFMFYNNLRNYENIKWASTTYDEFREEHLNWTEMNEFYTKGTFKRIYNDNFEREITRPLVVDDQTYYPVILKDSKEYNDESFIQSNCVKGYIKRPEAMIISLRKDDELSKERATLEFRITFDTVIELKRIQSLGRFNKPLTLEWERILAFLDKRVQDCIHLFETPKIKCKIGYLEFESDSHFNIEDNNKMNRRMRLLYGSDISFPEWSDKRVNNINDIGTFGLNEF
jgi:hypothetical protein